MALEFKLPELGENVEQGTIAKVLINDGDSVSSGQSVLELETDKAVAEIPSSISGTITEILVKDGQKLSVGDPIFRYEEGSGNGKEEEAKEEKPEQEGSKDDDKASGGKGRSPRLQVLEKPEQDKDQGQEAEKKGSQKPEAQPAEHVQTKAKSSTEPAPARRQGPVLASPSVRRLAREQGIDLHDVPLADPQGPVTRQDVLNYVKSLEADGTREASPQGAPAHARSGTSAPASAPAAVSPDLETDQDEWGAVAYEPMNAIRRATMKHMAECWQTIPHVTQMEKADITDLEKLRKDKKIAGEIAAAGGKLTVTSFIIKLLGDALKRYPRFNASLDVENEQLLLKQYYHVGIAVDTDSGLLVPVLRDVDHKSITDISIEIVQLAERARDRKLGLKDMQGATITLTNLGGLGASQFTPIVSAPQVAILGLSRARVEPVWQDGQFVPRTLLPLSLSYDHRVIDGADAARFMAWFIQALENPWTLFFDA